MDAEGSVFYGTEKASVLWYAGRKSQAPCEVYQTCRIGEIGRRGGLKHLRRDPYGFKSRVLHQIEPIKPLKEAQTDWTFMRDREICPSIFFYIFIYKTLDKSKYL